ncbi:MAG: HAD-IB family hydrolase [Chloroflexi bacterium]|nr:HAD-IB family hydrolase [Chloroflexota bacterium]
MRPIVAFFDVDGTLTRGHVWRGIMAYFQHHGLRRWTHRLFWAYHFPLFLLYKARVLPQHIARGQWAQHLAWYVRGYSEQRANEVWDWVVNVYLADQWRPVSLERLRWHQEQGHQVVLVSSGPRPLMSRIARHLGVQHVVATPFEVRNGRYTGRARAPVIGPEKPRRAWAYVRAQGWDARPRDAWAYGDAISDLPLLESVGHPVAVAPDAELANVAHSRNWPVLMDKVSSTSPEQK